MKRTIRLVSIVSALLLGCAATLSAAAEKEVTVVGEGKCGKCALKETASCQNVVEVTTDGKKQTYYLAQNDVSKAFHSNLCKGSAKVKATGVVKEENGQKVMTVSKIDLTD